MKSFWIIRNLSMKKWKQYFTDLSKQPGAVAVDVAHTPIRESFATLAKKKIAAAVAGGVDEAMMKKQVSVLRLISAYRIQGVGAAQRSAQTYSSSKYRSSRS